MVCAHHNPFKVIPVQHYRHPWGIWCCWHPAENIEITVIICKCTPSNKCLLSLTAHLHYVCTVAPKYLHVNSPPMSTIDSKLPHTIFFVLNTVLANKLIAICLRLTSKIPRIEFLGYGVVAICATLVGFSDYAIITNSDTKVNLV